VSLGIWEGVIMNLLERMNKIMPGVDRADRIREAGRFNPSWLESVWLGFSIILVELPAILVTNIWCLLRDLVLSLSVFICIILQTIIWSFTSIVLGLLGKMERTDNE